MSEIVDVILFYSKFSKACGPCIEYIMRNKLPVTLIPLDTANSREFVSNGSIMQIKNVPSMVVSYSTGDAQLYVGNQKIVGWLTAIIEGNRQRNINGHNNAQNRNADVQRQLPVPDNINKVNEPEKKRKIKKKKRSVKHVKVDAEEGDQTLLVFEDDDNSGMYTQDLQHESNHKSKNKNAYQPISGASKLSTAPSKASPNQGIMAMAKQMEADRNRHLNVKDGDK